jgi:muramidase (phage lysozyme)
MKNFFAAALLGLSASALAAATRLRNDAPEDAPADAGQGEDTPSDLVPREAWPERGYVPTEQSNAGAFLQMIRLAEGTEGKGGSPYRVVYGYQHEIQSFADHPAVTGEWKGERLSDSMCRNAGFGPGCISTAAGAYQIIKPTWLRVKAARRLPDFSPESQDAAALELIRQRGALDDVHAGRIESAIAKCRQEWASLPGNSAHQGQRSVSTLLAWYRQNGGVVA